MYLANLHGRDRFVRRVAVKVMREGLDGTPDLVARQKDEARLLGLLAHESIVQVLDLAEVQGRPAVVMEYVEGVDLSEVLKYTSPKRFPVRAALEVVAGVASALDAAFNSVSAVTGQPLRVIHRDIKPANMLLTSTGRVKVLDFGVAKADFARDGHTTNGGWGTPRFMAPEQWLGEAYGAPIDTYALGVTLFDLVADRPWERPPLARTPFEAHVAAQLDAQADVPEAVLALVAAMTAFDAADRPTPAEVRERAEAALLDAPGESLSRYARAVVPTLVEVKSRTSANQPVPAPISLGSASGAGIAPAERPDRDEPSMVPSTGLSLRPAGAPGWLQLVLLSGGVAVVLAFALVVGLSLWRFAPLSGDPELAAPAEPAASPGAPAAFAAGPTEPATTTGAALATGAALSDAAAGSGPAPADPAEAGAGGVAGDITEPAAAPREAGTNTAGGTSTAATGSAPPARIPSRRPSTPQTTTAPPAAPATASTASAATAPADAAPKQFPVSVTSTPTSAEVWIDGVHVGDTALRGHPLAAGTHTVWLVQAGVRSPEKALVVGPDGALNVRYDFAKREWRSVK